MHFLEQCNCWASLVCAVILLFSCVFLEKKLDTIERRNWYELVFLDNQIEYHEK